MTEDGFTAAANGQRAVDAVEVIVEEDANDEMLVELTVVANLNRAEAAHAAEAVRFSRTLERIKEGSLAFDVAAGSATAMPPAPR